MSDGEPRQKRRQGFWLTAGEIVGVLALLIAGLNYWDTRKQHAEETRHASAAARAQAAFVVTGTADSDGRRIDLQSLKGSQAIQSQRYFFPHAVLDHPMEVTAARPQIDLGWVEDGLRRAVTAAGAPKEGETALPVAIVSTYVEDGETRTDRSLYHVGYAWRPRLFGGPQVRLQGIALVQRSITGDPATAADRHWATPH